MNVIDLFAGAGGLSLGFEKAGFDVILANEYDREISNTYRLNHPHTLMVDSDIKEFVKDMEGTIGRCLEKNQFIQPESLFKKLDNIDVIIGGPPCQGFSMAGGRIRKVNEFVEDPRNELFKYYFEVIKRFEPKYFVFENVLGILSSKKGEIVRTIKSIFEDKNNFKNGRYYVSINIVNASDFGVAQARKRVIIFGSKAECDFNDLKQKTLNRLREHSDNRFDARPTVYDAISDLQKIAPSSNNGVPNHTATKHSEVAKSEDWKGFLQKEKERIGEGFDDIKAEIDDVLALNDKYDAPLEHIMKRIDKEVDGFDEIDEHRLGNLALLSKADNSAFNNSQFYEKREKMLKMADSNFPYSTRRVFLKVYSKQTYDLDYSKWGKDDFNYYLARQYSVLQTFIEKLHRETING